MNREELHQQHIQTVKKMLHLYTSYLVHHMNEGGNITLTELIDNFIAEHIKKEPSPEWQPMEQYEPR